MAEAKEFVFETNHNCFLCLRKFPLPQVPQATRSSSSNTASSAVNTRNPTTFKRVVDFLKVDRTRIYLGMSNFLPQQLSQDLNLNSWDIKATFCKRCHVIIKKLNGMFAEPELREREEKILEEISAVHRILCDVKKDKELVKTFWEETESPQVAFSRPFIEHLRKAILDKCGEMLDEANVPKSGWVKSTLKKKSGRGAVPVPISYQTVSPPLSDCESEIDAEEFFRPIDLQHPVSVNEVITLDSSDSEIEDLQQTENSSQTIPPESRMPAANDFENAEVSRRTWVFKRGEKEPITRDTRELGLLLLSYDRDLQMHKNKQNQQREEVANPGSSGDFVNCPPQSKEPPVVYGNRVLCTDCQKTYANLKTWNIHYQKVHNKVDLKEQEECITID